MKYEECLNVIKSLSQSQGFYGRLLRSIEELDDEGKEQLKELLEKQNFKDSLDLVLFFES